MGRARRGRHYSRRSRRSRAVAVLVAAALGIGLIIFGSATTTSLALSPSSATSTTSAPSCSQRVTVDLGPASVAGSSVTVHYTISGCVGTVRLHIHQNLTNGPNAGSDSTHQSNVDFLIGADSPTSQTVPLLDGADGKCFVQVDYSTRTQRRGIFTATPTCPGPSTSTPPSTPATSPVTTPVTTPATSPVTSASVSASSIVASPSTSSPATSSPASSASVSASSIVASPSTSSPASQAVEATTLGPSPGAAQVGPVPVTDFSGTVVPVRSRPYEWVAVIGIFLVAGALAAGVGLLVRRRDPSS